MDLYTVLGASLSQEDLQTNLIASKGEDKSILAIYESFTDYEHAKQELLDALENFDSSYTESYFSLENWETGFEGVIGDLWFKFVQFIKRIVAHLGVMWDHFVNGNSRQKRYLEQMRLTIKSIAKPLNWSAFGDASGLLYTPYEFDDLLKICSKVEVVLTSIYRKNDFELDSIMDFDSYGITFKDNRLINRNEKDEYATPKFYVGIEPKTMTYKRAGWNPSNFSGMLDKLIDRLEFNIEKDFKFIQFKDSMEKLIHRGGGDGSKYEPEKVMRLTSSIKSVVAMCNFLTGSINSMAKQMVLGCKALETTVPTQREDKVY